MDKFGEKFKKFITAESDDELYDEEEEAVEEQPAPTTSEYEEPQQKTMLRTDAKMIIFEPRSYEEATGIADYLKRNKACVVNIHRLQNEYRQRLIDFLFGCVYGIDGQMQKVGTDVFLCAPKAMFVDGQINENDD
ncbi:MAG: cell division protein SepF [Erysipelotrichaceae bacterium]|nr:cell division protein SepF [Erysipelotrichaceae bacterium]MBQ4252457.1 cell division protein SepF [Erysipelotrichaceae bacterium]MBQ7223252.1 cell division protein SepF [Erysipelotrichaceae bacterium]